MKIKPLISLSIAFLLLAGLASALGIAPAKTEMFYEPLQETYVAFNIINNENKDIDVSLFVKGELSQYITLEQEMVHLSADEPQKSVRYKINFPVKLKPGQLESEVWVLETSSNEKPGEDAILTAKIGVMHKLLVRVPYPDEYLEGILFISEAKPNEKVSFTVTLSNVGGTDLESVKGQIIITGPNQEGIARIITDEISLPKKEKSKITAEWIADVNPGTYKVQAIVDYDGKLLIIDKSLDIGEPLIEIEDVRTGPFKLGTIAKFDITIRNLWNQEIDSVFGDTEIRDENGALVNSYKSSSVGLPAGGKKDITTYWDTKDISPGNFLLGVKANYLGRTREKTYKVKVEENKITVNSLTGEVTGNDSKTGTSSMMPILLGSILLLSGGIIFMISSKKKVTPTVAKASQAAQPVYAANESVKSKLKEYFKFNMSQGISIMALKHKAMEKGYNEQLVDEIILDIEEEQKKGI